MSGCSYQDLKNKKLKVICMVKIRQGYQTETQRDHNLKTGLQLRDSLPYVSGKLPTYPSIKPTFCLSEN